MSNTLTDAYWLLQCTVNTMPMPPLERYIHLLPEYVVKRRLQAHERGFCGYLPDHSTLKHRDDNEIAAINLVREYTNVPVPQLVHQGEDFNVFTRIPGICVNSKEAWDTITPRQREGLLYQTREFITALTTIPSPCADAVLSPHSSGTIFRPHQLSHVGPFPSTRALLGANPHLEGMIDPAAKPVFAHMDWDLSNIIIAENRDYAVGVVDWERAAWFPEAGMAMHELTYQWDGWDALFEFEIGAGVGFIE